MANPNQYVRGYLRSYTTHDGKTVVDEPAEFTGVQGRTHSLYFDPDNGYRRKDAETLIAHWNWVGLSNGQSYRLA